MNKKLNILIVSSISPYKSAGLGLDVMKSLENKGHSVDFLTKYKFENMSANMISVYDFEEPMENESVIIKIKKKLSFIKKIYRTVFRIQLKNKEGIYLLNTDERKSPVDSGLILKKIVKNYDLVIILFWHTMLTTRNLLDIYNRLSVPLVICGIDMFSMTGGCPTFRDCRNFLLDCRKCKIPRYYREFDIPYHNFIYKKQVYNSIICGYLGNTWMSNFARKSPLFKNSIINNQILPINEKIFYPRNKIEIRDLYKISGKKFILFAGAATMKIYRKGFSYLIESVNLFYENIPMEERSNIALYIAGELPKNVKKKFKMDTHILGFINAEKLSEIYSLSDVFLCPSVDDPGPTMINQSIMCGTPVVSFEMGVAYDIVIDNETGYRAKLKDANDFANGIKTIYDLNEKERITMSEKCRDLAIKSYSLPVFAKSIEQLYNDLTNVGTI